MKLTLFCTASAETLKDQRTLRWFPWQKGWGSRGELGEVALGGSLKKLTGLRKTVDRVRGRKLQTVQARCFNSMKGNKPDLPQLKTEKLLSYRSWLVSWLTKNSASEELYANCKMYNLRKEFSLTIYAVPACLLDIGQMWTWQLYSSEHTMLRYLPCSTFDWKIK